MDRPCLWGYKSLLPASARFPTSPGITMFYALARPLLFRLDPETAHTLALRTLQRLHRLLPAPHLAAPRRVMGLDFPNPVGLAAGLDKDADYIDGLARLGFGFLELGTVTPRAQPGNPRPRLFRLTPARALINRMGFNNRGVDHLLERVRVARYRGVLGINLGKNADTPLEQAAGDYLAGLRKVYPHAGYVTVNLSSPNTPGLRDLQHGPALSALLAALKAEQARLAERHGRYVPLVVKVAPDLDDDAIERIAATLIERRVDGLIATNTTATRGGVTGLPHGDEAGGLSGAPLSARAAAVLARFRRSLDGALPIIAAGGIMRAEDARKRIDAGAALVQLYTGLIYRGPALVRECVTALADPAGAAKPNRRPP